MNHDYNIEDATEEKGDERYHLASYVAHFPGLSVIYHSSIQIREGKHGGCCLYFVMSGRQRVNTLGTVHNNRSQSPFLSVWLGGQSVYKAVSIQLIVHNMKD